MNKYKVHLKSGNLIQVRTPKRLIDFNKSESLNNFIGELAKSKFLIVGKSIIRVDEIAAIELED